MPPPSLSQAIVLVWLTLGAVLVSGLAVAPRIAAQDVNCNPPSDPDTDWNVAGLAICTNRTITVRNLVVLWAAQVTLQGVTLIIDADVDASAMEGQGVRVFGSDENHQYSGTLKIFDSTLRPLTNDKRALFETHDGATIQIVRTKIQNFRDIRSGYVTDFLMEDSSFIAEGRRASGIKTFSYPNYRFVGNFISNVNTGIQVGPGNILENNTITNCGGAVSIDHDSVPAKVMHNTITGCFAGIGGPGCTSFAIRQNDIFANGRNAPGNHYDASFCGDARYNWWERDPPTADQFQNPTGETFTYDPWLREPVHPERLPRPAFTGLPASLSVNQTVTLDALGSQPSTGFKFPLTSYEWDLGNGQTRTGATLSYVFPHQGTFTVTLRAVDSMGLSRSTSATVTVDNRPPTVDPIRFEPNPPIAGQDLRAYVTAQDPDGDTVRADSYRWSLNGSRVPELDNKTFVPAVQVGQTWRLVVTVRDDMGATATTEATATVPAPTAPTTSATTTSQAPPPDDYTPPPPDDYTWTPPPSSARPPQKFEDPIPAPTPSTTTMATPTNGRLASTPDAPRQAPGSGLFLGLVGLAFISVARRRYE